MNHAFLVRVLDGPANLNEQFEPFVGGQMVFVAIIGDLDAPHQFHDEERPARVRGARIQHFGDVGMVHQRQRLPLGFKSGDHIFGLHAQLDDLQRHPAANRRRLFSHIHHPAPPLADWLEQFVMTDLVTGLLLG